VTHQNEHCSFCLGTQRRNAKLSTVEEKNQKRTDVNSWIQPDSNGRTEKNEDSIKTSEPTATQLLWHGVRKNNLELTDSS
jgi:hypothetical protein